MRLRAPDTMAGRTILAMLLGLGVFHLCSIGIYQLGLEYAASTSSDRQLAERMVSIKRAAIELPAAERDEAAHRLSSISLDVHWSQRSLMGESTLQSERSSAFQAALRRLVPPEEASQIHVGIAQDGSGEETATRHFAMVVSMQVADGSWLNFSTAVVRPDFGGSHGVLASTTAMALGIVLLSVVVVRWLTAPLRRLASAARELRLDRSGPPVPEIGPREIRDAANAFNGMQARIRKLVQDRTQSLAALSHDLKTPLTRLRLRSEFLGDDELRRKIADDIDEMHAMIDATLAFLGGDTGQGEATLYDLTTLLRTVCDELADTGEEVAFEGVRHLAIVCRPLVLKRAFANLIGNAVKYGDRARVAIAVTDTFAVVTIDDDGSGIAVEDRDRVFEPYQRLETSRSRETGGSGLGLTVARAAIEGHGGTIFLSNREGGGLRVTVTLPREVKPTRAHDTAQVGTTPRR